MIVSKKISIYFYVIAVSLLFLGFGIYSYLTVLSLDQIPGDGIKKSAEDIFFWGITLFILILFSGAGIIHKSFRFEKSLDKLLLMSRTHGISTAEGLKKLGRLGNKLSEIYIELNSISERKSIKIASLNRLINIIFTFIEKKVIVLSVTGEMLFISEAIEKKDKNSPSVKNRLITEVFPDFNISAEIDSLVSSRSMKKIESMNAYIYPVFNFVNELDYMVLFFDAHINLSIIPASKEIIKSMKKNRLSFFNIKKLGSGLIRPKKKSDI